MKRVLLLAYMFPPIVDGGGFRPFAFARYLPEFGYQPIVLTRPDTANLPVDRSQLDKLPSSVHIDRLAYGFEEGWLRHVRRRLSWLRPAEAALGKPAGWIADGVAWRVARRDERRPWEVSWMEPAIARGLRLIEQFKPDVILATAPPFESLKAGYELHTRTGIPLVADFRDPWTYGVLWKPATARRARIEQAWERRVIDTARHVLVVTPSMRRMMIEKYPEIEGKLDLLMNGFEDLAETDAAPPKDRLVVSMVGTFMERRLSALPFEALRRLRALHPEVAADVRVQLIGPDHSTTSPERRIAAEGLSDMVTYLGAVGHDRCRELMRASHVLLHLEPTAWYAVSSKVFEYLAAERPILGMVPAGSDDELFLKQSGAGENLGLDDPDKVVDAIHRLWSDWRGGRLGFRVDRTWLKQFHRREQTRRLAGVLDAVRSSDARGESSTVAAR
jgi:Glycosyltransferase Family 4/Glycosyl transferases group 1